MTPELKQRLVGATVLFFLAGLLWVILFDFDAVDREIKPPVMMAPSMPTIEAVVVEPATPFYNDRSDDSVSSPSAKVSKVSPSVVAIDEPSNEKSSSAELSDLLGSAPNPKPIANKTLYVDQQDRPRLDAQGVPIAFVVQLGSFSRFDNADKLRNLLVNDHQFKAYLEPKVEMTKGPYKVLVGPVLTYADVKNLAAELKKTAQVKEVIIKRFGDT